LIEHQVDAVRGPDVEGAVELEEDKERKKEAGDTGEVGIDEKVGRGRGDVVVESVLSDVDAEKDAAGDEDDVVVDELLGDGIVKCWGPGGSGVELAEGMDQQLRRRKKKIDRYKTEDLSDKCCSTKKGRPVSSCTYLTEPKEGHEEIVGAKPCDHPVGRYCGWIHPEEGQADADESSETEDSKQEDDEDHDVVATDVGGDWHNYHGHKDNT